MGVARAALQAALQTPGVVGSDPGPSRLRVTADPPADPLVGVSATAQADGRYGIDLSLVADLVPLPELAEQVRERIANNDWFMREVFEKGRRLYESDHP